MSYHKYMRRIGSLVLVFVLSLTLAGCSLRGSNDNNNPKPTPAPKRQIINALPIKERPFVALFPHPTGKLLTLYFDKPGSASSITLDIEYLAGNALKGGRTSINPHSTMPYTQGFLLGSCSAGGKCSFDTDITSGDIKTKLEIGNDIHVLKSNFTFVTNDSSTSDQKVFFTPTGKVKNAFILGQTHGYIGNLDKEVSAEPVAITSSTDKPVIGQLRLVAPNSTSMVYYDGSSYQTLPVTKTSDGLAVAINLKPWSKTVNIVRDDQQGKQETVTLYLVGPFVAF